MNSTQARLMAGATTGVEKIAWGEAAKWLDSVEQNAQAARLLAQTAASLASMNEFTRASLAIKRAVELQQHDGESVWLSLWKAIDQAKSARRNVCYAEC
jgi:hypothetical protein